MIKWSCTLLTINSPDKWMFTLLISWKNQDNDFVHFSIFCFCVVSSVFPPWGFCIYAPLEMFTCFCKIKQTFAATIQFQTVYVKKQTLFKTRWWPSPYLFECSVVCECVCELFESIHSETVADQPADKHTAGESLTLWHHITETSTWVFLTRGGINLCLLGPTQPSVEQRHQPSHSALTYQQQRKYILRYRE